MSHARTNTHCSLRCHPSQTVQCLDRASQWSHSHLGSEGYGFYSRKYNIFQGYILCSLSSNTFIWLQSCIFSTWKQSQQSRDFSILPNLMSLWSKHINEMNEFIYLYIYLFIYLMVCCIKCTFLVRPILCHTLIKWMINVINVTMPLYNNSWVYVCSLIMYI